MIKRKKVWFSPVPGVGLRAIDLGASIFPGMRRTLVRDLNGRCLYATVWPDTLYARGAQ